MDVKKEEDLRKLAQQLDITPTMYRNAVEKYKAINNYLDKQGMNCNVYPQGSFALGTTVRPYKEAKEEMYDLDVICEVNAEKNQNAPNEVRNDVETKLKSNGNYSITSEEKCITVNYAEINGAEFKIDVVPAVPEDSSTKNTLIMARCDISIADMAVALSPKKRRLYNNKSKSI